MRTPPYSAVFAVLGASLTLFAACSPAAPVIGAAPPPQGTPAAPTVALPGSAFDAGSDAGDDAEVAFADAGDDADAGPTAIEIGDAAAGAGPKKPAACPDGMKLVDGEYCTDVEHKCLKSWYDKSNKKTICEEFAPTAKCIGQKIKKRYCVDAYEWPNKKGERPEVMNRFHQAQVKCASVGKRMCTESEWTLACEGPQMTPYPYGYVRDATKCNGDHKWDSPNMTKVAARDPGELARLWKGVRSGSQPDCVSAYGVADLPANTDEVVAAESPHAKYDSVNTGGPWYKGVRNQCRPKIYTHSEDFYYYFLSFRCCAEPDGKATDPRTPKQVKDGWKFNRVEKLAFFSITQMQDVLQKKAANKCECKASDVLCKTMCGTLLGPAAVDATH